MKKLISALLIIVMLFGIVPFSNAAKNTLGATEASAKETVNGSFRYLKDYICKHGTTDSSGENIKVNIKNNIYKYTLYFRSYESFLIIYNRKSDEIRFEYLSSDGDEETYVAVSRKSDVDAISYSCFYFLGNVMFKASFNPAKYYYDMPLKYKSYSDGYAGEVVEELLEEGLTPTGVDETVSAIIKISDMWLESIMGISIGNFGFTKIANPMPLPTSQKSVLKIGDFTLNYKKKARIIPAFVIGNDEKPELTFEYTSSNPSVVTVDGSGSIYATGRGETTITCTVKNGSRVVQKDVHHVTVDFSFGQWLIWIFLLGFLWY